MSTPTLACDFLVIGAGMAGLSAAGWAAERGASVVVVEKAPQVGGSAALSGGMLWTATSAERMALYGGGSPRLSPIIRANYPTTIAWLRQRGIDISHSMRVLHGCGYQIDILGHLRSCVDLVEHAGGHVVRDTDTISLLLDPQGRVTGARTTCADGDVDVQARWTLLATGGFQGSPELRARCIHANAERMLLRSNPYSRGDGLRLGQAAGGEVRDDNPGFYGHLVSESAAWGEPRFYTLLAQYHSDHCLLINEDGVRFCDETMGDHTNTGHTLRQTNARAVCFWDQRVHQQYACQAVVPIAPPLDRMAVALEHGGKGIVASTVSEIAEFATSHRFNGQQAAHTIASYNQQARTSWETVHPLRSESCLPLDQAPYYALIVHPAITFSYGGLTIDPQARVLRTDGTPVAGLLAAGSDAGDAFGTGYAGGLALAMSFGVEAARTAGYV